MWIVEVNATGEYGGCEAHGWVPCAIGYHNQTADGDVEASMYDKRDAAQRKASSIVGVEVRVTELPKNFRVTRLVSEYETRARIRR